MTGIAANLRTNAQVVLRSNLSVPKKRAILARLFRQVELLKAPPSPEGPHSVFSLYEEEREDLLVLSREMEAMLTSI